MQTPLKRNSTLENNQPQELCPAENLSNEAEGRSGEKKIPFLKELGLEVP